MLDLYIQIAPKLKKDHFKKKHPEVTKECFLEALKYLKTSRKHGTFVTPGNALVFANIVPSGGVCGVTGTKRSPPEAPEGGAAWESKEQWWFHCIFVWLFFIVVCFFCFA